MVHCCDFEVFALLQVLTFEGASDYVDQVLELGNSKINPIVHHLSQGLEGLRRYVEKQDLRTGDVGGPVELVGLVAADDEDVGLVDDDDFSFTDFFIEDLEASPFESLKIVKSMLIKLREVEQFLRDRLI